MAPGARPTRSLRAVVIADSAHAVVRFRGGLIRALLARGAHVLAVAPGLDGKAVAGLTSAGAPFATRTITLDPPGPTLQRDRRAEAPLGQMLATWQPDLVVASGSRTAMAGAHAGRATGAGRVTMIVDRLGVLDIDDAARPGWLAAAVLRRRRAAALRCADLVVFHNPADRARLVAERTLAAGHPHVILPGSGIDVAAWPETALPPISGGLGFLMVLRPGGGAGVAAFAAAAALVKARSPNARFVMAGATADGLTAAEATVVARGSGCVTGAGQVTDLRPEIARAHIVVDPTAGDGCPACVLEAMSMGRPVIVADGAGARPLVEPGETGSVVPACDAEALAAAMAAFLKRPDLIPRMARASRQRAVTQFAESDVSARLIAAMGLD